MSDENTEDKSVEVENQRQAPDQVNADNPEAGTDLEPEEQALADPEEVEESTQPETEAEGEPQMSRRKAQRLEKLHKLVDRLENKPSQPKTQVPGINYREMIEADDQVYTDLDKATREYGQGQYDAGLQQAENVRFHTRLEIDAPRVESKYSQLNAESPDFNPQLADAVNRFYLGMVGYDPQTDSVKNSKLRYSDFVDAVAELGEAMFSTRTTQTAQNLAKQAAHAAVRPGGPSAKPLNLNKAPEDMTNEELNAVIKATLPRDSRGRFTPNT